MNSTMASAVALVGRILLAAMFLMAGYGKIGGFAGTVGYISSVGLPAPQVLAAAAVVVELVGGALLLIGWKARWAALALAGFTVMASVLFHNYWAMPVEKQMLQSIMFTKNAAVVGGLLMVAALGAGGWSVDRR